MKVWVWAFVPSQNIDNFHCWRDLVNNVMGDIHVAGNLPATSLKVWHFVVVYFIENHLKQHISAPSGYSTSYGYNGGHLGNLSQISFKCNLKPSSVVVRWWYHQWFMRRSHENCLQMTTNNIRSEKYISGEFKSVIILQIYIHVHVVRSARQVKD